MHSATQIIAQRAPPASRTTKAARWQPYLQSATSHLPLRSPSMHTPNQLVPSPAPSTSVYIVSSETTQSRPSLPSATAQTPKELSQSITSSKQKFATGLIDQAVSTLSDIWRPQDIPSIFLPPVKAGGCSFPSATYHLSQSKQLAANLHVSASQSPSTQPPFQQASISGHSTQSTPSATLALLASGNSSDQILPLKTFVHEVLRRSRTSGNVLQTALCYLEAIRPKVPEILHEENVGIRAYYQPESRIQPATPEELEREAELCALEDAHRDSDCLVDEIVDDSMKTVRITEFGPDDLAGFQNFPVDTDRESLSSLEVEPSNVSMSSSSSSPALPSPLLCPRRAFLASLILASKFSQDKCYSNRAWAKLSGLPPREIGRCERALGQALQWRLWVGKCAIGSQPENVPVATPSRTVVRSQSETSVLSTSANGPFLSLDESSASSSDKTACASRPQMGIRRCMSLPEAAVVGVPSSSINMSAVQGQNKSETRFMSMSDKQEDQIMGHSLQSDDSASSSPSPPTPTLTYSPSSTDSSGDRTIQVSTLEDNMYTSSSYSGSQPWINAADSAYDNGSVSFGSGNCRLDGKHFARHMAMIKSQANAVAVVDSDVATFGANYLWSADSRYILEAAEVH